MNSMNTSLIIFFNQATKKLTFGIDESHSGLKNKLLLLWSNNNELPIAIKFSLDMGSQFVL